MSRKRHRTLVSAGLILLCAQVHDFRGQKSRFSLGKVEGSYFTNQYQNLFVEDGHTTSEVSEKIAAAYRQIFHGDAAEQAVYYADGENTRGSLAYVFDVGNGDVRSEGMSYGMMLAVQLNHKAEFDALWNWVRSYMYISDPSHPSYSYYAWSCERTGEPKGETPAPDGEEYIAMSLYFASARWGDGTGIYNYHRYADDVLRTLLHRRRKRGRSAFGFRDVGAAFSKQQHMIRFLAEQSGRDFTDPSYQLPGFYELWGRWGPREDRHFWRQAARTSRAFFIKAANRSTGLTPVLANFDGTPHSTLLEESDEFGHDAWRVASNWAWDAAWFGRSSSARTLSDLIQSFFSSQGRPYGQVFTLSGKTLDARSSTGLVAANAVTALAASPGPQSRAFTEELWNAAVPTGNWRYYDGLLYMLSLLHVSGNFRIWTPVWSEEERSRTRSAHRILSGHFRSKKVLSMSPKHEPATVHGRL